MGKLFQTVGVKQDNMFWPEHVLLDGCFSFKMEDLVFILSCPDGLCKLQKYWQTFFLKNFKKKYSKKFKNLKALEQMH